MNTIISSATRRGFLKTLAVGAGGYALGSSLLRPKEATGESTEDYLEKIPMATRWAITSGNFVYFQISDNKALFDKLGQEKYNEFKKKTGLASGARNKKNAETFGFTGDDAKSVAAMATALVIMYYGPTQQLEIFDATSEKASVKCPNCAYWNTVQARKITDDTCSAWSQYWWEGFVMAMNPKMTLKLVKARPLGDSICEWAFILNT